MNTHDQSRELRKIETTSTPAVAELTRTLQTEVAAAISALPRATRLAVTRQVQPHIAETFERVVRSKLAAAAEAEIACFAVARLAQRQLATVQHLRNEGAMRGLVTMALSDTSTQLFDILVRHEENVDAVSDRWRDRTRTKLAEGQIDQAEADRRLSQVSKTEMRLQQLLGTEVEVLDRVRSEISFARLSPHWREPFEARSRENIDATDGA